MRCSQDNWGDKVGFPGLLNGWEKGTIYTSLFVTTVCTSQAEGQFLHDAYPHVQHFDRWNRSY